jgi:hypothetical protein
MIRALTENDTELLREAFSWRENTPPWFRQMVSEGQPEQNWDDYLEASAQMVEFGLFDPDFCGLISLYPCGSGVFSAHISAPRGTDPEKLALAAFTVREWLFKHGAKQIVAWVAARHRQLKRLCLLAGLTPDTVTMIRGQMKGKLITWERFSARV